MTERATQTLSSPQLERSWEAGREFPRTNYTIESLHVPRKTAHYGPSGRSLGATGQVAANVAHQCGKVVV